MAKKLTHYFFAQNSIWCELWMSFKLHELETERSVSIFIYPLDSYISSSSLNLCFILSIYQFWYFRNWIEWNAFNRISSDISIWSGRRRRVTLNFTFQVDSTPIIPHNSDERLCFFVYSISSIQYSKILPLQTWASKFYMRTVLSIGW